MKNMNHLLNLNKIMYFENFSMNEKINTKLRYPWILFLDMFTLNPPFIVYDIWNIAKTCRNTIFNTLKESMPGS